MRKRRYYSYKKRCDWLPSFCCAFGLGILCAIFFSVQLALVVSAVLLIMMGKRC